MAEEPIEVIIIGAGLTGLSLAYFLKKKNIAFKILESRDRLGGRIHTLYGDNHPPLEMGATWLGAKHKDLIALLDELGIRTFRQELGKTAIYEPISTSPHQLVQLPPNNDPSFRIRGGTATVINELASHLDDELICLEEEVESIVEGENEQLLVQTKSGNNYATHKVVSTLPPYLFFTNIKVEPELPTELKDLMQTTHTWMGESIKISFVFDKPFWRDKKLSGTIFSNVGPVPEMYDHSNFEDDKYALKGFLNGTYFSFTTEERKALILKQLTKYFGAPITEFAMYKETVWRTEDQTFLEYKSHVLPHQNNGHPLYNNVYLDNRLFIGGSETASSHPGYMDGAVLSAKLIANKISSLS